VSQPARDWKEALEKVGEEGACRACGRSSNLETAHVSGRKFDKPKPGRKTLWVDPDDVVPLCGNFAYDDAHHFGCHARYDAHDLDLLPYLRTPEQVKAVQNYGSIELARRRLAPSLYREKVSS
jgi:hypothetical protein